MPPEVRPDFTGQVVKLYVEVPDKNWAWWSLTEPVFQTVHGRVFLVGRMTDPKVPGEVFWGRNTTAALPWELVRFYLIESVVDRQERKYGGPDVNTMPL